MGQYRVDSYVVDTLMLDLVEHDRQPSAFLVYLHLWCRAASQKKPVEASYQSISNATGLSKSSVQAAIRNLARRQLIRAERASITAVPRYTVLQPWKR
jgi:hypothetical protein